MDEQPSKIVDIKDRLEEKKPPPTSVSFEFGAFRKVLRNRGFMALWVGQGISGIGDWVIVGVLLASVYNAAGENGLAIMLTFRFLPAFLFGLVAGAVVDLVERKTIMIVCEICRASLVVVLAFSKSIWMIGGLVFGIECFSLLFAPARDSSIPDLVDRDDVIAANSLMSTSTYLTMAIGTMIATVILGLASFLYKSVPFLHFVKAEPFKNEFAFIVDAFTFLISAMLIYTIAFPRRFEKKPKISAGNVYGDLKEGLRFMSTNRLTRAILGVMIIGFIGGGSLYVLGAPFAKQVLHKQDQGFTLILTMLLFGVVAGAALAPWVNTRLPAERWFARAVMGFGGIIIVFSFIDFYLLSLIVIFMGGALLGYMLVTAYTLLHQNLDEDIRGRVFAAMQTIMRTCLLLSMGVFALVAGIFKKVIPYSASNTVGKSVNFGFMTKTFFPAMLALIVGGAIVIVGGLVSRRSFKLYSESLGEVKEVDKIKPAT